MSPAPPTRRGLTLRRLSLRPLSLRRLSRALALLSLPLAAPTVSLPMFAAPVFVAPVFVAPVIAIALIAAGGPAAAQDGPIDVSGPGQLGAALSRARGGETIRLAPGDYGRLILGGPGLPAVFDRPVTLIAADPARPPRVERLAIVQARNLVLDGFLFDYVFAVGDDHMTKMVEVAGSRDITLRNSVFDGDLARDTAVDQDGYPSATGVWIRHARDVVVEYSVLRRFGRGVMAFQSDGVTIRGNDITQMRSEGMNFTDIRHLTVETNWIHDFLRNPFTGDHSDMIQFWTTRTTAPTTDVTIRGNLLNAGRGLYTQSIFLRNEEVDTGRAGREMFYRNLVIEDNVIINAHLHGITVGEAEGVRIRRNTLIHDPLSDGPAGSPQLWTPRINVKPVSDDVEITDNITVGLSGPEKRPDWTVSGNLAVQDLTPGAPGWYDEVFLAARTSAPEDLGAFLYRPGGPADPQGRPGAAGTGKAGTGKAGTGGPGAPGLRRTEGPLALPAGGVGPDRHHAPAGTGALIPVARVAADPSAGNRFVFSAAPSLLPPGTDPAGVGYAWHFADGSTAEGPQVVRDFAAPGRQEVALILTLPDGTRAGATSVISVPDPNLVHYGAETGGLAIGGAEPLSPWAEITSRESFPAGAALPGTAPVGASAGPDAAVAAVRAAQPAPDRRTPWRRVEYGGLPAGGGPIRLGPDLPAVTIPAGLIQPLSGARQFEIDLTFRTRAGSRAPDGEILRVHPLVTLGMTAAGGIGLQLLTEGQARPATLATPPLRLHDGAWHRVTVRYDGAGGRLALEVDGQLRGQMRVAGVVARSGQPLSLGNPFGQKTLDGEVSELTVRAGTADFSAAPAR